MTGRAKTRRARRWTAALCALVAVTIAACGTGAQNTLKPVGPVAKKENSLFFIVFWIAVVVFVLVEGLIVYASIRFRAHKREQAPVQIHGNTRMEIGWTIAPALLLLGLAIPTVATIFQLAEKPVGANVVNIKVIGHQWWWEYDYDANPPFKTATELVVPTGRKIHLEVTSADVIHSFWVPKLFGKQDAVPSRMNPITFEATEPGTYYGQCVEFCALSHANMRLRAIAKSPADYDAWVRGQQQDAVPPPGGLAAQGAELFRTFVSKQPPGSCVACHTLRGVPEAQGQVGPDLTHFASRFTFAGAIFDRNDENVTTWLTDPPGVKPGSIMPNYHLSADMIRALVAFLETLK